MKNLSLALSFANIALAAYRKRCAALRRAYVANEIFSWEFNYTRHAIDAALDKRLSQISARYGVNVRM